MARTDTLPIYYETYKLVLEVYKTTLKFPREYKFCLGQDMNRDVLQLFRLIFQANHQQDRVFYLDSFLSALEMIRVEIRLCAELKILSLKRFVFLCEMMERIGKQAAAWRKHEGKKEKIIIEPAGFR